MPGDSGEEEALELNSRGIEAAESGDLSAAEDWFRAGADAGNEAAASNLVKLLRNCGRSRDAIEAFSTLTLKKDVCYGSTWFEVAQAYEELGETDAAIAAYRRAIDDGEADARVNLGVLLVDEERADEAIDVLEDAISSGDIAASWQLGDALRLAGRDEDALNAYQAAYAVGEHRALRDMAVLLAEMGRDPEARRAYELGIDHGDPAQYGLYALFLADRGELDRAHAMFVEAETRGVTDFLGDHARLLIERGGFQEEVQGLLARAAVLGMEEAAGLDDELGAGT